jgi:hypothetical protein
MAANRAPEKNPQALPWGSDTIVTAYTAALRSPDTRFSRITRSSLWGIARATAVPPFTSSQTVRTPPSSTLAVRMMASPSFFVNSWRRSQSMTSSSVVPTFFRVARFELGLHVHHRGFGVGTEHRTDLPCEAVGGVVPTLFPLCRSFPMPPPQTRVRRRRSCGRPLSSKSCASWGVAAREPGRSPRAEAPLQICSSLARRHL